MSKEGLNGRIVEYLSGTIRIRDYSEKKRIIAHLDGYDQDKAEFTVTPWDICQIAINSGDGEVEEVRAFLLEQKDYFTFERNADGLEVLKTKGEGTPEILSIDVRDSHENVSFTVEDAFKWYLYHKIQVLSENGTKPVGISDGIFAIKNELFLPDDFVPPVMMEMVEGSKMVDVSNAVVNIQPTGRKNAIFILGKHDHGKFLEPDSFYANPNIKSGMPEDIANLGKLILKSFEELQQTDEYKKFLLSRVMRNVIFTVETKGKRELGKPMFDPGKLKILEMNGLVTVSNGKGTVPDDMSVEDLKKVRGEAEKAAENVSRNWMKSEIKL